MKLIKEDRSNYKLFLSITPNNNNNNLLIFFRVPSPSSILLPVVYIEYGLQTSRCGPSQIKAFCWAGPHALFYKLGLKSTSQQGLCFFPFESSPPLSQFCVGLLGFNFIVKLNFIEFVQNKNKHPFFFYSVNFFYFILRLLFKTSWF